MPVTPVDFASLLCSRLCHDLLSPVGALNNGLELLADETDPAMRQRCMDLLAESARTSANKLKFFRLAFGAAGGFGDQVDTREARAAIEGLLADNKRLEVQWLVEAAQLPKPAAKALLNLAMIGGDALVRGGSLRSELRRRAVMWRSSSAARARASSSTQKSATCWSKARGTARSRPVPPPPS
jgi:histidine phosphotransferase ChpT